MIDLLDILISFLDGLDALSHFKKSTIKKIAKFILALAAFITIVILTLILLWLT